MRISDKKIIKKRIFNQSLSNIWDRWTTKDGLKSFFGVDNDIELKIGGKFEIYFLMNQPYGLRGSEGCKILSFLPQKMLSFSWNAPPKFKEIRDSDYKCWVVLIFNQISFNKTEVILTHLGWPDDEMWTQVFNYFDLAWETVFNDLQKHDELETKDDENDKKDLSLGLNGIGGIFFKANDPENLKKWYSETLEIPVDQYGAVFEWRNSANPDRKGFTQWSIFSASTDYFLPSKKDFMINYRVYNLKKLVEKLKDKGVKILDDIEEYDYGKFIHILDPEGNKIELWEPDDIAYEKLGEQFGSKTIK